MVVSEGLTPPSSTRLGLGNIRRIKGFFLCLIFVGSLLGSYFIEILRRRYPKKQCFQERTVLKQKQI